MNGRVSEETDFPSVVHAPGGCNDQLGQADTRDLTGTALRSPAGDRGPSTLVILLLSKPLQQGAGSEEKSILDPVLL